MSRKKKIQILSIVLGMMMIRTISVKAHEKWNVFVSPQSFIINGKKVSPQPLNINNSNYIKVAEFAELLNIDVEFDEISNAVSLDQTKPFTGVRIASDSVKSQRQEKNDVIQVVHIKIDKLRTGEKIIISEKVMLEKGYSIVFDIQSASSTGDIFASFVEQKNSPDDSTNYYGSGDYQTGTGKVNRTISKCDIEGEYYVRIANQGEHDIFDVKGTVTIQKNK